MYISYVLGAVGASYPLQVLPSSLQCPAMKFKTISRRPWRQRRGKCNTFLARHIDTVTRSWYGSYVTGSIPHLARTTPADTFKYLGIAAECLSQLAQVTQNVPYLQLLSGVIVYAVKAHEVTRYVSCHCVSLTLVINAEHRNTP